LKAAIFKQASIKREQLEEDNYKQKVFMLNKWAYLKQLKLEMMGQKMRFYRKVRLVQNMAAMIKIQPIIHLLAAVYSDKKIARIK
jgi:hypothetical protein